MSDINFLPLPESLLLLEWIGRLPDRILPPMSATNLYDPPPFF